jgi:UDP-N-acetylglucosamine 2-epimerase (non-hydrolysing)
MSRPRVCLIMGTRPEAIKMAPLVRALRAAGDLEPVVVASGQHPAMVSQALAAFDQEPDETIALNRRTGEQAELVAQLCPALDGILCHVLPAALVVQGDTTSALVGGLVAHWRRVPLVHLEAGLRSGDLAAPFPEEANRRMLGVLADLHLAPTSRAVEALRSEGVPHERTVLVGNTVVDAVLSAARRDDPLPDPLLGAVLDQVTTGSARLMLVTAHRRESWGEPLARVLTAVRELVHAHPDVQCVLPAHANPAVRAQIEAQLGGTPRVVVTDPLPYTAFCRLMSAASMVLSDSGGIQEEAPSFGVPTLVLRTVTERQEAVEAGWAQLVGTDTAAIVARGADLLAGRGRVGSGHNPFGDGHAGERSAQAVSWLLGLADRPSDVVLPPPSSVLAGRTQATDERATV